MKLQHYLRLSVILAVTLIFMVASTVSAAAAEPKMAYENMQAPVGKVVHTWLKNTDKNVTWKSTDKKIATVKSTGKNKADVTITGASGQCKIIAEVNGKKYEATVRPSMPKLSTKNKTLNKGKTYTISVKNCAKKVKWSSTDKNVATVKSKGMTKAVITAKNCGSCVINAKITDDFTLKCTITVPYDWDKPVALKYSDVVKEAAKKHKEENAGSLDESILYGLENIHKGSSVPISMKEIYDLCSNTEPVENISYDKAVSDIDLYFRALKYGYSGYEYFGGDKEFNIAKENALKAIGGKSIVSYGALADAIYNSVRFCIDGHFSVNGKSPAFDTTVLHKYYYNYEQLFSKDKKGFYKKLDGKKWYYKSSTDPDMFIDKTLLSDGRIVYSPVLLKPASEVKETCTVTLVNGNKKIKEKFKWYENESYLNQSGGPDFIYTQKNGLAYISERNFINGIVEEIADEYIASGKQAAKADTLILDYRSNCGGNDSYPRAWVTAFSGKNPSIKEVGISRETALSNEEAYGSESYRTYNITGNTIANKIPVMVLVDDENGSSGERCVQFSKAMDNVLTIGSNTAGCMMFGNVRGYTLPNSGIYISFSKDMGFNYNLKSIEGVGMLPDVWCNPKYSLEATLNLMKRAGLTSAGTNNELLKYLTDNLESYKEHMELYNIISSPVCIRLDDVVIKSGQSFMRMPDLPDITVVVNGKTIKDYTYEVEDETLVNIEKLPNGLMRITPNHDGECKFYVTVNGETGTFIIKARMNRISKATSK